MQLDGIHHVTAITADAQRNLDFYVRALGLRFVKKTVNFDQPDAYHLYYGDERGSPGSAMTFFEFPGAAPGRAGAGMVHTVAWRVGSDAALDFWAERLGAEGVAAERPRAGVLHLADPEGLALELVVADGPALAAQAPGIPAEHALQGFDSVRSFVTRPEPSEHVLADVLAWTGTRPLVTEPAPDPVGIQGAGTVHHVAFHSTDEDHEAWRARVAQAGLRVTPVIDRQYFHSIYFREPGGVLYEIATTSPGFDADEPLAHLGEELKLPPQHEARRTELERRLVPLVNPRAAA